jgi:hypothetical protein
MLPLTINKRFDPFGQFIVLIILPRAPKRLKRSEAVERLERLERALLGKHQGSHIPRGLKKGIRKILTGTSLPLDRVVIGDPRNRAQYRLALPWVTVVSRLYCIICGCPLPGASSIVPTL